MIKNAVSKLKMKLYQQGLKCALTCLLLLGQCVGVAFAADNLGDVAEHVSGSFFQIGSLMIAASYVAGFAIVIAAIFKFKQHRDQPTQVPLGTAIALLCIGILLVFLPSLFAPAGETLFSSAVAGGFQGSGAAALPGAT